MRITNSDNAGGYLPCPRCKADGILSVMAYHLGHDVTLVSCDHCRWGTAVTEWSQCTKPIIEIWNDAVKAELCRATAEQAGKVEVVQRKDGHPGIDRLWDSQWVNVVNHDDCYRDYSKEDAVSAAVQLTERKMAVSEYEAALDRLTALLKEVSYLDGSDPLKDLWTLLLSSKPTSAPVQAS